MSFTQAQAAAVGRHVISYAAGAGTVLAGVAGLAYSTGALTHDQVASLTSASKAFVDGLTTMTGAVLTIASVTSAAFAAWSSTHQSQLAAVAATPGTTIVTTPEVAAATPSPNVVSNTEVAIVPAGDTPVPVSAVTADVHTPGA